MARGVDELEEGVELSERLNVQNAPRSSPLDGLDGPRARHSRGRHGLGAGRNSFAFAVKLLRAAARQSRSVDGTVRQSSFSPSGERRPPALSLRMHALKIFKRLHIHPHQRHALQRRLSLVGKLEEALVASVEGLAALWGDEH